MDLSWGVYNELKTNLKRTKKDGYNVHTDNIMILSDQAPIGICGSCSSIEQHVSRQRIASNSTDTTKSRYPAAYLLDRN